MNARADKVLPDPVESLADVAEAQTVGTVSPSRSGQGRAKSKASPGLNRGFAPFRRVEERFGKSIQEVCQDLAAQGYSRNQAAIELGIPMPTFKNKLIHYRIEADWPGVNQSLTRKAIIPEVARKNRQHAIERGAAVINGETLRDISKRTGLKLTTLVYRYEKGCRGERLERKTNRRPKNCSYSLGITVREWEYIIEYMEGKKRQGMRACKARDAAAQKFGVPSGAISAVENGEWWRIT